MNETSHEMTVSADALNGSHTLCVPLQLSMVCDSQVLVLLHYLW